MGQLEKKLHREEQPRNGEKVYLVIDLKNGLFDGYYKTKSMARRARLQAVAFAENHGLEVHLITASIFSSKDKNILHEIPDECFLANGYAKILNSRAANEPTNTI